MKCPECGTEMKVTQRDHRYKEVGLPGVLLTGVEFRECPACGESEMAIPRLAQLHRFLAEMVATKVPRLTAAEIRFLRKHLGWSGEAFAAAMGVRPETVSRWENEKEPMGIAAERLLRVLALRERPVESYPNDRVAELASESAKPVEISLRVGSRGWQENVAA